MHIPRRLTLCCTGVWALAAPAANAQFPPVLDLLELTPQEGALFLGELSLMMLTFPAHAGDLNDDGFPDVIFSAPGDAQMNLPGTVYVVFGGPGLLGRDLTDLAGLGPPDGFVIQGPSPNSFFGWCAVSGVDFNADGIDDLAVGAPTAEPPGGYDNGQVFVIFGQAGIGAGGTFDLAGLDGSNGFVINGRHWFDWLGDNGSTGVPLGALDFNADGHPDLVAEAFGASAPGRPQIGQVYIIFGGPDMGAGGVLSVRDLDGTNGITVNGLSYEDRVGVPVDAGDVNDDGVDDLLFGHGPTGPPWPAGRGLTFVLLGGAVPGPGGVIELADMPGNYGYVIYGPEGDGRAAALAPPGDVNGDGVSDILVWGSSGSYVLFGGPGVGASGVVELGDLDGSNGFLIDGLRAYPLGDINDDGFADFGRSRAGASPPDRRWAGISYVAYGFEGMGASGTYNFPQDLDGQNGFVIWGAHEDDFTWIARGLADINGDGVAEFTVNAPYMQRPDGTNGGGKYILFGRSVYALGDLDRDGDVDIGDFANFALCYNGSLRPPAAFCPPGVDADLDNDGDVDLDDFAIFAANYTGSL